MSLWVILAGGVLVTLGFVVVGVRYLLPSYRQPDTRRDLGVAIITTAVFSFAVFVLGVLDESRLRREESIRQEREDRIAAAQRAQDERDAIRLQVALQKDLTGIELQKKDLRGFFFRGRKLREAQFQGADLRGANFAGVDLTEADLSSTKLVDAILDAVVAPGAIFSDADMRRTSLIGANLSGATMDRANLRFADVSGANMSDASLAGVKYFGLKWDAKTVWPDGRPRECSKPKCVVGVGGGEQEETG